MKLTKEECLEALEIQKNVTCLGEKVYGTVVDAPYDKSVDCFEQLINEHFDNNMARTCQNLVSEIDKLDRENSQLRYDLKFMEINFREAVDHANEFLEMVKKLEKALDKACDSLVELDEITVSKRESYCWNKEEWKEYLLNE